MFEFDELSVPLVVAPMAGGPSTPRLVAAAANAGAFGFLAGGYQTVEALAAEVDEVRALTRAPFGVNLFVPAPAPSDADAATRSSAVQAYRGELAPDAERYGVILPATDPNDTDHWDAKIAWLLEHPVPVVSFTFGIPDAAVIEALHAAGSHITVTVTDPAEAGDAAAAGADSLCLQGPDAGGHRGTHAVGKVPDATPLAPLLARVVAEQSIPIVAAGGVGTAAQGFELLTIGASAVQLGTLMLRSPESGASAAHKRALASGGYTDTTVTRAFSGRGARGLTNRFIRDHGATAPAAYPEVNQLVRPLRAAAAATQDADGMALWAGTGFAGCRDAPAGDILTQLWADEQSFAADARPEGRAAG